MHHPVFAFAGVLLVLEYTSVTTAWPVTVDSSADNFPSIDISLSPPLRPLPKIATHIGSLDASREASESLMMERVQRAGQQALTRSKANIDKAVKHFMHSFADSSPEKFKAMYMALVADPHQVRNPKKACSCTIFPVNSCASQASTRFSAYSTCAERSSGGHVSDQGHHRS